MARQIIIHALSNGSEHPLDTRERLFAWFADEQADTVYRVTFDGKTYLFGGAADRHPRSPSDLIAQALNAIPGNSPDRHPAWSLLDDFTRAHCLLLADAMADHLGGERFICGLLDPEAADIEDDHLPQGEYPMLAHHEINEFHHAGVLIRGNVYCAFGRQNPDAWAYNIVRSDYDTMRGRVSRDTMHAIINPNPPQAVVDTIPAVITLISLLVGDDVEPRHPRRPALAA